MGNKKLQDLTIKNNFMFAAVMLDPIRRIKADREMGARYMTFQQLIKDERKEAMEIGRAEGRVEGREIHLRELVKKKLEKGQSVEQIADALEESKDTIQALIEENM